MAIPILHAAIALSQFAPVIARWIGGSKVEGIANAIVDIAKKVTNTKNEEDAIFKIQNDQRFAMRFQRAVIEAERDIEIAIMHDKESARNRDLAIINSGRRNKRADIMVISSAVGLVICLVVITCFQGNLPGEAVGVISTIAGIFGSCLKDAYSFEFGSSRGSKEKDLTVASFLNK